MSKPRYFKTSVKKCLKNPITLDALETLLALVGVQTDTTFLSTRTVHQRAVAEDWACRVHLAASDNIVRVPQRPSWVTSLIRYQESQRKLVKESTGTVADLVGSYVERKGCRVPSVKGGAS